VTALALLGAGGAGGAQAAARVPRPDLRVLRVSVSAAAPEVRPGAVLRVRDRIANGGRGRARRSTAGYYLSHDWLRSGGDVPIGGRSVRALRPHARSRATRTLLVPRAGVEGYYRLIECADVLRRVRERVERNNCTVAAQPLRVVPDREPPAVTIDTPLPGGATFDATPVVAGSAGTSPGDAREVAVRLWSGVTTGSAPLLTLTAELDASGRWGAEPLSDLPRGTYTVRAEQDDEAGNVALSDPVTFAIGPATLLAAGDVASCSNGNDDATERLLAATPAATVAMLGDGAYENGTLDEYGRCFAPSWGVEQRRIRPTPGNHDYGTGGAAGYFEWFGAAAGEPGKGWYSYDLEGWHVVVLNGNCSRAGGCYAGSEQERWLAADLAAHPARCTLAYWHQPLFSSDPKGGSPNVRPLWERLYAAGAELVLNAHAHHYERFAPKRPDGTGDAAGGIREIVAGTGGRSLTGFGSKPAAGSEYRSDSSYGIVRVTLDESSFAWEFEPAGGAPARDRGSARCH
jgi:hypothetical protein